MEEFVKHLEILRETRRQALEATEALRFKFDNRSKTTGIEYFYPKFVIFDDFGPANRGRVCQPFGNTAGDTQTSSGNRRSALVAESGPISAQISLF